MSTWLLVVLVGLASARLTRLLVLDALPPLAVARMRVRERWGDDSWQAYLAHCPWCVGVYVAAAVTAAATACYGMPAPVLVWLTAAWLAGFLTVIEPGAQEPN